MANAKTIGFILVIFGLSLVPLFNKDIRKAKDEFHEASENPREIFTGKTRAVYEPLDEAYKVTDVLRNMVADKADTVPAQLGAWPVLSIWIDPADLNGAERGIFANPWKHGRLWERASYVSYFENGQKLFGSYAGIRVHGGKSRNNDDRSVRLYFKKSYGEPVFLKSFGTTMGDNAPIKKLLVRRDTYKNFTTDFAFEIIRKLGGMTPKFKHAAVFINGKLHDYSQLGEFPHDEQAAHFFGHKNFIFYKLKGDNKSEDHLLYEDAIRRIQYAPEPIDFGLMDANYDLRNFTANLLTIMYTGNTDWAQGIIIKDQQRPNSKWKIISWDFDRVFHPVSGTSHKGKIDHAWEMDSFKIGMKHHDASLRSRLFNRLIKESPEYKKLFFGMVDELFEEVLTPEFMSAKLSEYRKLTVDAGNPRAMRESVELIEAFVANRKAVFCRQMKKALGEVSESCLKESVSQIKH